MTVLALWSAGAVAAAAWAVQGATGPVALALAVALVLAVGAIAGRAWLRSPTGTLAWDGESWTLATPSGTHAGTPEVALDAQRLLLLRWRAAGRGGCWLWLERATLPARWDDLRRAVYSRPSPQALPGAQSEGEAKP